MARWLWTQKQDFGPPFTRGMVYDSSRRLTIALAPPNTWEWDGGSWVQVDDMGPPDCQGLIYDTLRQRLISFGLNENNNVSETWEWDGVSWTQLADTGPAARRTTAMAYDSVRDRVVLFGGNRIIAPMGIVADTWEWNGEEWTQQEDQGPGPRWGHQLVYDSARKQTVMFGGARPRGPEWQPQGDTWAWDGQSWKLLADFGPSPRFGLAMAYDDAVEQIVLFGGATTGATSSLGGFLVLGDTWSWDGLRWIQRQDMGPPARGWAGMAYDSAPNRQVMVLFGGWGASDLNGNSPPLHDTWELNQRASAPTTPIT